MNGEAVYLVSEMERRPFKPINTVAPRIVYCGNIRLGRNKSLCDIADALRIINPGYKLTVYSNDTDKRVYGMLKEHPNIDYRGFVPYSVVRNILDKSDIAVAVEGFGKKDVYDVKYSLSTKTADLLAGGCFVLGYGSEESGAIEYLKSTCCGLICTSKEELIRKLPDVLSNTDYQRKCYENAAEITAKNHNLLSSTKTFERVVEKVLS